METKPEKQLNTAREVGRGYLNGWGTILAYATVGLLIVLLVPMPAVEPVKANAKGGSCGCS